MTTPRLGQPMYYYRCFIGEQWRKSRLVLTMLKKAFAVLEGHARRHAYPCIGMVLELENTRFSRNLAWTGVARHRLHIHWHLRARPAIARIAISAARGSSVRRHDAAIYTLPQLKHCRK